MYAAYILLMDSFKRWLEYIDAGPFPATVAQDRQPHNVNGGIGDKGTPRQMRRNPPTSAFPTYGGDPLPGNKKTLKKG